MPDALLEDKLETANSILAEAIKNMEHGRVAVDGPPLAYFMTEIDPPNRFVYLTFRSGGQTAEGTGAPALFKDPVAAVHAWIQPILMYIRHTKGAIFWRIRPKLEETDGYYSVYSRVVVADVPPAAAYVHWKPLFPKEDVRAA